MTTPHSINPAEYGRWLKDKFGDKNAALIAHINMSKHIIQWLITTGNVTDVGARELVTCHYAMLQVFMQTVGKKGEDVPVLLKMAEEAQNALAGADAIAKIDVAEAVPQIIVP